MTQAWAAVRKRSTSVLR